MLRNPPLALRSCNRIVILKAALRAFAEQLWEAEEAARKLPAA